jgi:hypothetical protein
MRGLFRPLEEYADSSILTMGALCFVVSFGCMLEFSSESTCLFFFNLHSGGWNQGPLDTAAT